jgi:bacteriophage HK97-gp10 putative tail-component
MADLDNIRRKMIEAAEDATRLAAFDLMGAAQRDAPIEEGTLRASAVTEKVEGPGHVDYEVSFNTPYAAYQHEHLKLKHPMGGKAKYLEHPLQELAGRYEALVAAAVARAVR